MKKAILILQWINFFFKIQDNQMMTYFEWRVLGFWPKSLIFKRSFPKKKTSFISFQQTRLWIDMIFEMWELIPE